MTNILQNRYKKRVKRTRNKLRENKTRARLSVFRSNAGFYAQIIDDNKGVTVASVSIQEIGEGKGMKKSELAEKMGETIAQKAKEKKVTDVVFDKGAYKYHGRVKAFAEGARKGGLNF